MKKILFLFLFFIGIFTAGECWGRENVDYWYIKNFEAQITLNKDSSLDIVEKITADCGRAIGKHGIFRIIPEKITVENKKIETPVELVAITDFSGKKHKFSQSKDRINNTVTWKIGDPDKTVNGLNYYLIHYRVENAVRFWNENFDELYWNLSGNFWDLEIDNFEAKLILPEEINSSNAQIDYYTGALGEKRKDLATWSWASPNTLSFKSLQTIKKGEGITASATFPKNIIIPYKPGFLKTYGEYLFLIIPFLVFYLCFRFWKKHGQDPKINRAVIAEYDIPGNLCPMELGMLQKNGSFKNNFISAEIINLAVKNIIKIEEIESKIPFLKSKDYRLEISDQGAKEKLNEVQKLLFDKIFKNKQSVELSSLKNSFYKDLPEIKNKAQKSLEEKDLISQKGLKYKNLLLFLGIIIFFASFFLFVISPIMALSLISSGLITLIFSFIMPKRTPEGAVLNHQIKGLNLFMKTVDKHRALFYEKENIFEKYLPYAIVFGITGLWAKKMKEIYGEEYFNSYSPIWLAGSYGSFSADSFAKTVNGLSASISSNTSSPSGSGGSGGSGGGGGGGGGGGW